MFVMFSFQLILSALRPLYVPNDLNELDIVSIGELNYFIFGSLPLLLQSSFAIIGSYWIVKGWQADVIESRRFLRKVFSGALVILFVVGTASEVYVMEASQDQRIVISQIKTFGGMLLIYCMALISLKFEPNAEFAMRKISREQDAELDVDVELSMEKFNRIFCDEKSYLEPGLSIADLAKKLAMPQYRLRELVNKSLGYRNFNALLNEYRIKDACEMLSDSERDQSPILTIALSVGYQSIAPFNQAFKELKGVTPTEFRKQSQRDMYFAKHETLTAISD
ncbi:MAG: helix-turn-helix domain-containing protein [Pseudomonadales bacterium]|nr:helix-turn-helix domain-containing protein [Pseudomonadales bacterium]